MSEHDPRPIEARLESAFDRFNRAAISGMEPTPQLFMEALEAEGLQLALLIPEALGATSAQPLESGKPAPKDPAPVGRRAGRLVPRRARAS